MDDRRESTVKSTRPYAVNVLASGHLPQSANITVFPDGSILWIVDIALGIGPHILYMTDAKGYTGGVGPPCQLRLHCLTEKHDRRH